MPGYIIVDLEVTDPTAFEQYRNMVSPTIAAYGGKYLVRGGEFETLEGNWTPKRVVVLEFPTMERAREWYNSPEYAPARQIRHRSARTNLIVVQGT